MLTENKNSQIINELREVFPADRILSDFSECYAYCQDAINIDNIKNFAVGVVLVETVEEVQSVVKIANKYNIPLVCRGAGTNVVGACIPERESLVISFIRMNKILEINSANMTTTVQSGVIVGDLQREAEKKGLFYPPDPSNLAVSTIGGSIAQSSAGAKAFKYGTTKDYVLELTVVSAGGEIIKTGSKTIKNACGYNLNSLFVGSEGTLGIIVEAVLKLIPMPESKSVMMCYFDKVEGAINAVSAIISHKITPCAIDFMDKNSIKTVEDFKHAGLLTDKECALVIEIDGLQSDIKYQKETVLKILSDFGASEIQSSKNTEEYNRIWSARRASMGACARLKPNVTTDDLIVPRENLAKLVLEVRKICEKYGLIVCMVGHVGDGSVHPQIPVDFSDKDEINRLKTAKKEIYALTVSLGGIISGEHGIGMLKREDLALVVDKTTLNYMREIKKVFDPKNILNPDKIFYVE